MGSYTAMSSIVALNNRYEFDAIVLNHPAFEIIFVFTNGIGSNLASKLERRGIIVRGNKIEAHYIEGDSDSSEQENFESSNIVYNQPQDLSTQNIANIKKTKDYTAARLRKKALRISLILLEDPPKK
ncbi:hypothetical protein HUJ04_009946 [Dendroctonus ponderosae]|nr:hypothetical protein HUJ04_009946 [Dendroctonus ponderosae]